MNDVDSFIETLNSTIVNPLIKLLFAAATLFFLFGVYEFIQGSADENARKKGRQHMLWAVIGFAIMVSAVAIVKIMVKTIY